MNSIRNQFVVNFYLQAWYHCCYSLLVSHSPPYGFTHIRLPHRPRKSLNLIILNGRSSTLSAVYIVLFIKWIYFCSPRTGPSYQFSRFYKVFLVIWSVVVFQLGFIAIALCYPNSFKIIWSYWCRSDASDVIGAFVFCFSFIETLHFAPVSSITIYLVLSQSRLPRGLFCLIRLCWPLRSRSHQFCWTFSVRLYLGLVPLSI